ncbi:hypothetical protein FOZ60_013015 [Perkinsus olseni]|uniref:Uncharacterized protein n=1 Tax=Perkinsus olseni TaxID=32597 RepID=A0A7J6NAH7_PEROL|nr:hypothetical protein FOZ60_013015 [Perkinsus olseni]
MNMAEPKIRSITGFARVTAWDEKATRCIVNPRLADTHPVIILKAVRAGTYEDPELGCEMKELTVGDHSDVKVSHEGEHLCVEGLRDWWKQQTGQDGGEPVVVDLT